jgi:membrane-bound metal-dependent hydrolase YbcI (DUF457 family)
MPLPIGHTALGLVAYEMSNPPQRATDRFKTFALITILANLPDMDVVVGLILQGNGAYYHRGPTHSLLFAILSGYLASRAWRLGRLIPRCSFSLGFMLVFSHILGDMLFTSAPVSLFWPLELNWSGGYDTWSDVIHSVLFRGGHDLWIVAAGVLAIAGIRFGRSQIQRRKAAPHT